MDDLQYCFPLIYRQMDTYFTDITGNQAMSFELKSLVLRFPIFIVRIVRNDR